LSLRAQRSNPVKQLDCRGLFEASQ